MVRIVGVVGQTESVVQDHKQQVEVACVLQLDQEAQRAEVVHQRVVDGREVAGKNWLSYRPLYTLSGVGKNRASIAYIKTKIPQVWTMYDPESCLEAVGRDWELEFSSSQKAARQDPYHNHTAGRQLGVPRG
jgi:ABC-type cobalt transport system, ATPase component